MNKRKYCALYIQDRCTEFKDHFRIKRMFEINLDLKVIHKDDFKKTPAFKKYKSVST